MKGLDAIGKKAILTLDIDPNTTKASVTNAALVRFVTDVKRVASRKRVLILVIEKDRLN